MLNAEKLSAHLQPCQALLPMEIEVLGCDGSSIQHPVSTIGLYLHLIYAIVVFVREKETAMAPMIVNTETAAPVIRPCHLLPDNRHDWPSDERDSYREVIGELDAWSRRHDQSKSLNSWIAEEAVRRCA